MYFTAIDLDDKNCVVFGYGNVAKRRIEKLLSEGAYVNIISPDIENKFENHTNFIKDSYNKKYLNGNFLVFAATDNEKINQKISEDAENMKILHCSVNASNHDFIYEFSIPSMRKNDSVELAVSTNGAAPSLSKILADKFIKSVEELNGFTSLAKNLRRYLKLTIKKEKDREELFKALNGEEMLKYYIENGRKNYIKKARDIIKSKKSTV